MLHFAGTEEGANAPPSELHPYKKNVSLQQDTGCRMSELIVKNTIKTKYKIGHQFSVGS